MKQAIFGILLFAGLLTISSCKDTVREEPPIDSIVQVLRSADSARADIAYFDTVSAALLTQAGDSAAINYNAPIKAFTVRAVDLLAAMGMNPADAPTPQYDHIRVYLGFNKQAGQFKLYMVPVQNAQIENNQAGTDFVLNAQGGPVQPPPVYEPGFLNDKFVLDLNAPCPNLCDVQTPLLNNNQ